MAPTLTARELAPLALPALEAVMADPTSARARAAGRAFHRVRKLAADRVGLTPRARIGWLTRFVATPLDRQTDKVLVGLGLQLLAFAFPVPPAEPTVERNRSVDLPVALSPRDVRRYQNELLDGLRGLGRGEAWPQPATASVIRNAWPNSGRLELYRQMLGPEDGPDATLFVIVTEAIELVMREMASLRVCSECGLVFVRVRRQLFCSTTCQQRDFDRRRPIPRVKNIEPAFDRRTPPTGPRFRA